MTVSWESRNLDGWDGQQVVFGLHSLIVWVFVAFPFHPEEDFALVQIGNGRRRRTQKALTVSPSNT